MQQMVSITPLSNITNLHPRIFLLLGIPGMEAIHTWLSVPFCLVYLGAHLGNFPLLFIVRIDSNPHEPMYFFLCMLSDTDLILSTTAMPKILSNFWFHNREIHFEACLVQVFLIRSLCSMASGFILAMALDRYVAICNALRHSAIPTHGVIRNLGIMSVVRGGLLFSPQPLMLRWLPYCRTNTIPHTYCEFMALIKLACAETRIFRLYSLTAAFLTGSLDFISIICSYIVILYTVFRLPSKAARLKTLGTCGSHVCVILVAYTPAFFSFLTHRCGHNVAPHIHIFVANIYLLVPPLANPMIYGIRTKTIRERFLQILTSKKIIK
ncbi:olfactory receptor Olr94 [Rattus norvegicus]|uniref:Olfactory receptor n=1 Tax=Rattus norvegicus TaxID=10116 RepID=D4ACZ6_RAT|nr:olfactory receptor Olr94 [Rattus norvegicus]|eukprot:NP_001001023.1 olfactory receptor Olr94 [Rattus norvegicus]